MSWALALTTPALVLALTLAGDPSRGERPVAKASLLVREALDYSSAIRLLEQARRNGHVSPEEEPQALELLGIAYVARGDAGRAEASFVELHLLDPAARIDPLLGPKVVRAFERAAELARPLRPHLELTEARHTGGELHLAARLTDPRDSVAEALVHLCPNGQACAETSWPRLGEPLLIPLAASTATRTLAYWVEARSRAGQVVAGVGTAQAPLRVVPARSAPLTAGPAAPAALLPPATPAPAPSDDEEGVSAWVWVLVGAAVVGAATAGLVLGLRDTKPEPSPGALFGVEL